MKYEKEDLFWEATRRNENYKIDYYNLRDNQKGEVSRWRRLWHPSTNYKWRIPGVIDPTISIDEIKKKIENGADPMQVHPYYKKYRHEKKAVLLHNLPYPLTQDNIDDTLNRWVQTLVSDCNNRLLVSVNPNSNDDEIFKQIKSIKKDFNLKIKDEKTNESKFRPFSPTKIKSYIGWLRKYDKIVEEFLKEYQKSELISPKGFIRIPPGRDFQEFVPVEGDSFETNLRAYRRAYAESVNLIEATPNIVFIPARIEK